MNMTLDYEFEVDGRIYEGIGVNIGDTCDVEAEREHLEDNKKSAICHEFDLSFGYDDEK